MRHFLQTLSCILCLYITLCHGKENKEFNQPQHGNLTLPTSQQPGPLFSFGQNIVEKHNLQIFDVITYIANTTTKLTGCSPYILYGVSDSFSLLASIPIAVKYKDQNQQSSGLGDIALQAEYAFYNKNTLEHSKQATLVANITFPSGSTIKDPILSVGALSFFIGATANYLSENWYFFGSTGVILTKKHHDITTSNQYLYQGGIGKNLTYLPQKLIITGMLEFFGLHKKHENTLSIVGPKPRQSGFFIGPSLWISSEHLVFQGGIAFPLAQQLAVDEKLKNRYILEFNIGWKFN